MRRLCPPLAVALVSALVPACCLAAPLTRYSGTTEDGATISFIRSAQSPSFGSVFDFHIGADAFAFPGGALSYGPPDESFDGQIHTREDSPQMPYGGATEDINGRFDSAGVASGTLTSIDRSESFTTVDWTASVIGALPARPGRAAAYVARRQDMGALGRLIMRTSPRRRIVGVSLKGLFYCLADDRRAALDLGRLRPVDGPLRVGRSGTFSADFGEGSVRVHVSGRFLDRRMADGLVRARSVPARFVANPGSRAGSCHRWEALPWTATR